MKTIVEHSIIPAIGSWDPYTPSNLHPEGFVLNPDASAFDQRYFFVWNKDCYPKPCYTATYVVGAQRIDGEELIIEPKMKNLDFMKMFSVCLSSNLSSDLFSKIYDIDLDSKPISIKSNMTEALTPLMIVHFLLLMKRITSKGLRSDFIERNENLKKVKGRIDIRNNERKNVFYKRFERVYCNYSERSINIPENRLFKKTLLICKRYISKMVNHGLYTELFSRINLCLSMFEGVDENIELQEIHNTKRNNLFKDYTEAVNLSLKIIKKLENSIVSEDSECKQTPAFWIDMALLYEHYVYGLLYNAYGSDIKYQASGKFGWRPDFLNLKEKLIMDAKYIPSIGESGVSGDIVAQLGGYSRIESFTRLLGVGEDTVVPCVVLYPLFSEKADQFGFKKTEKLMDHATPIKRLVKFYTIGVPIPKIDG